ncbi:hypothetical protein AA23498_2114 [Acetobacter nitrogenifigens DSM 23921 = NBRC 105050]|uniref:Uncharacterized protein n=1 Tax=Acetobacter nitrogenifigens DSM 23921 = NBRC 105050 TaxID=1120919 RepID=A0A511XE54_9PROT|nr:hypothetical protein AA23498_2114 [Acetobacter nitrogenifigens DSM 23921 = NBRC 105050]GEN61236.1 hypothetical protein ANI02nite_31200 [Acetobacter nitrogenifigens DSM 23921 = NBRC 105050]
MFYLCQGKGFIEACERSVAFIPPGEQGLTPLVHQDIDIALLNTENAQILDARIKSEFTCGIDRPQDVIVG